MCEWGALFKGSFHHSVTWLELDDFKLVSMKHRIMQCQHIDFVLFVLLFWYWEWKTQKQNKPNTVKICMEMKQTTIMYASSPIKNKKQGMRTYNVLGIFYMPSLGSNAMITEEVLLQNTMHLIQRSCYKRGSPCQHPAANRTTRWSPDHCKETQTEEVWTCVLIFNSS